MAHSFAGFCRALAGVLLATWLAVPASGEAPPAAVEFNRDIRPILSDNCFFCHGPDAGHRQADLRLDQRDAAVAAGAVVPGKLAESTIISRIN